MWDLVPTVNDETSSYVDATERVPEMLNQAPHEWTIIELTKHIKSGPQAEIDGVWQPARCFGMFTLTSRFRLAWLVFTGRADALRWPSQDMRAY